MKIDLTQAKPLQTLCGWGTSACWWSQYCEDEATQNELSELLYGESGLKLNIYRYNIGGGFDETNCRVDNPWRRTESFMLYDKEKETTSWDFSRDKNAVTMMKKCLALDNIDTLILFANSPHYSQTSTGQASGSLLYHTCNIPKMNYRKFVDYLLDVTEHFLNEGLPVKYLSPINEPQWKWGGGYVWQEGCHYEPEEVAEIFHLFAEEILRRGLPIKLYGPESGELLGHTKAYLDALQADETIMQVLEVFAVHSYHADNAPEKRYEFRETVLPKCRIPRVDMSEWCELPNKSHTKDFNGALITARIIGQDLIYTGAESWTSWVAVNNIAKKEDGFDYADSLFSATPHFEAWSIAERYFALAHYSKFIPVGATALDFGFRPTAEDNRLGAYAFALPDGGTVIVAVNETDSDETLDIIGDFANVTVIRSTQNEKLKTVVDGAFGGNIALPSKSILTILLK